MSVVEGSGIGPVGAGLVRGAGPPQRPGVASPGCLEGKVGNKQFSRGEVDASWLTVGLVVRDAGDLTPLRPGARGRGLEAPPSFRRSPV